MLSPGVSTYQFEQFAQYKLANLLIIRCNERNTAYRQTTAASFRRSQTLLKKQKRYHFTASGGAQFGENEFLENASQIIRHFSIPFGVYIHNVCTPVYFACTTSTEELEIKILEGFHRSLQLHVFVIYTNFAQSS